MSIAMYDYQLDALSRMSNGCILCGGVGSGKSRTSLAYYFTQCGGCLNPLIFPKQYKKLYIITTARKRDTGEWDSELATFTLSRDTVIIDSWNNIKKYSNVENSFFIFDEQRVVGYGAWTKAFLKIAKSNSWILLSATPGDTWSDYIPVFIANGFFKNKTQFEREHIVYSRINTYPKIDRYLNTGRLIRLRNKILVDMDFKRQTVSNNIDILCDYDITAYKYLIRERFDIDKNDVIQSTSELCYALRKVVNSDPSRIEAIRKILNDRNKVIIFYSYDYELDILRTLSNERTIAEWNGHKHQNIPDTDKWIYLVQYTAGAEGWNCIKTDTIIFYSQQYSYKILTQSRGRIDRLNTPYSNLYYYNLISRAPIDRAILAALKQKKNFNEGKFLA